MTVRPGRVALAVILGSLLMQFSWIAAMPPFRGVDEFDHAYRADSVALGNWSASEVPARDGRGTLLTVHGRLVHAASRMCTFYQYTGHDNCHATQHLGHGLVTVASAAATYNPVFYWVIGTAASPFTGLAELYGMRITNAILCSLLVGLAAWSLAKWSSTRWPLIGTLAALTPVTIFSMSIASPNGIEIAAGLSLWCCLLGLAGSDLPPTTERALIVGSWVPAIILAGVRQLGPLWLGLSVATILLLAPWSRLRGVVRRHLMLVLVSAFSASMAAIAGAWWTASAGSLVIDGDAKLPAPFLNTLRQLPLWILQSIAAFPTRTEQAPTVVYTAYLLLSVALIVVGLRLASVRLRLVTCWLILITFAVPFLITLKTYSVGGAIWQGRYTLPFSVGVMLLAALAPESRRFNHRLITPVIVGAWLAGLVAQVVSVANVQIREEVNAASISSGWPFVPLWVVITLVVAGGLAWLLAVASFKPAGGATRNAKEGVVFTSTSTDATLDAVS